MKMSKELLILSAGVAEPYLLNLSNYLNQEFHERKMNYTCVPWTEQIIYSPGADTISSLLSYGKKLKDSAGYTLCLFTPDDEITINRKKYYVSRDNVWLEYGLFSGILGPERVFAVCPNETIIKNDKKAKWHRPSDFTTQEYRYEYSDNIEKSLDKLRVLSARIVGKIAYDNTPIATDSSTGFDRIEHSFSVKQP